MDTLQKLIVIFFGLTMATAIIGTSMFYIEKPYISKADCSNQMNSSIFYDPDGLGVPGCTYTEPKDASPFMEGMINASVGCGIVFLILSGIAYYKRPKKEGSPSP